MQRNEVHAAGGKHEDGEFDQLVTHVVRMRQHVLRHDDEGAVLRRNQHHVVRLVHHAAEQAGACLRAHRGRRVASDRCLARRHAQFDAEFRRHRGEAMFRQSTVCRVHQGKQFGAVAFEAETATEDLSADADRGAYALAEWIRDGYVSCMDIGRKRHRLSIFPA